MACFHRTMRSRLRRHGSPDVDQNRSRGLPPHRQVRARVARVNEAAGAKPCHQCLGFGPTLEVVCRRRCDDLVEQSQMRGHGFRRRFIGRRGQNNAPALRPLGADIIQHCLVIWQQRRIDRGHRRHARLQPGRATGEPAQYKPLSAAGPEARSAPPATCRCGSVCRRGRRTAAGGHGNRRRCRSSRRAISAAGRRASAPGHRRCPLASCRRCRWKPWGAD